MKHVGIIAVCIFAWLFTTNKIVEVKSTAPDTYSITYQKYCTTTPFTSNAKGMYILTTPKQMYIPINNTIMEYVTVCP